MCNTHPLMALSFPDRKRRFCGCDVSRVTLMLGLNQGFESEAIAVKQVRQLRERLKRVQSRLKRPLPPKRILLRDKLAFVLGVMLCMYARLPSCIMFLRSREMVLHVCACFRIPRVAGPLSYASPCTCPRDRVIVHFIPVYTIGEDAIDRG